MFLSRRFRSFIPTLGGLAVAAAAWLLAAAPATAQQRGGPQIPIGAKAFQVSMIQQEYLQRQFERRAPAGPQTAYRATPSQRVAPIAITVAVTVPVPTPAASRSLVVDLRGPNGEVRSFAVEGGSAAIESRTVTVRAGESVTLRIAAAQSK